MKKLYFLGIIQGLILSGFCNIIGYDYTTWQFWLISIFGIIIGAIIYVKIYKK